MNQIIDKNFFFDNNPHSASQNEFKEWEKKVLQIIHDIAWRKKSLYRELFYFYPNTLTFKQLRNKVLFKINNIINFECRKAPFAIKVFADKDARENLTSLIATNDSFFIRIKIDFGTNHVEHSFKTILVWVNKRILNLQFKKFDAIDEAIDKIGLINKKSFYEFSGGKQSNLLLFLQGTLEDISPDLTIEYIGKNIDNPLKTPLDSEFQVMFQKDEAFSFLMEIDEVDFLRKNTIERRWKIRNIPVTKYITNKRRTFDKWKVIAKTLRINFEKLWNYTDSLYEVVKTVKHLFDMLYGEDFANAISITTSFPLKTKLINLKYKQENQLWLNFKWYFNSYNFKQEIFNMQFNTIKIDDQKDYYKN